LTRSEPPSAYDRAVKLLARRTHFRRELAEKLAARGYPREEIDEAFDRLAARRYLDDAEAARQFLEGRLARGGYGRSRLQAELAARGVERSVADAVLDDLLPEDDLDAAREEARRHAGRSSAGKDPAKLAQKIARCLERRGFSARAIAAVLREQGWETDGEGA
jgi:regulatory protein